MPYSSSSALHPTQCTGLVAFWDFQEGSLKSQGTSPIQLQAMEQPLELAGEGVFSPHSLRFRADGIASSGYLRATREAAPRLNIGGTNAQVSLVAWIKRESSAYSGCQFVAGVWNEHAARQYGLFLNLGIWESREQVGAHVSSHGGATPGHPYCMDAAIGATPVGFAHWHCIALTYDGTLAMAYLDGVLDVREPEGESGRNPFHYSGGLFKSRADFTVGAVARPAKVEPDENGGFREIGGLIANPFVGLLGGLAVFERALNCTEIAALARNRSDL